MDATKKNPSSLKLVYIIGTYPLLTTTFIEREVTMLRKWGVDLHILSIRQPKRETLSKLTEHQERLTYLLPISFLKFILGNILILTSRPIVYFKTLTYLLSQSHPSLRFRFKTLLHFGEGVYTAYLLNSSRWDHIHAHFVDRAAIVALVVSRFLKVPYSVTAHANDIYVNPILLTEKISNAKFAITCTEYNANHLSRIENGAFRDKIHCIFHGLDASKYQRIKEIQNGSPRILAVGQLKEKKGFTYLIKACRLLIDSGFKFKCLIIGEGPLEPELNNEIQELSLNENVKLLGKLAHDMVIKEYQEATIFVLPSVLAADGDRDGIPNVILEAMAMELPVVSTLLSGIPEAVLNGVNGYLVPPADEVDLASAIAKLLDQPVIQRRFGRNGRNLVVEKFDIERNVRLLHEKFIT